MLDASWVGHLGLTGADGEPVVIPTTYVRIGNRAYLHGSSAARLLTTTAGRPLCLAVTLLDGLVLARSGFNHSMNYRSAVVFGVGLDVIDPGEVEMVLDALVERMSPGRSGQLRRPTRKEVAATKLIAIDLTEASVKVRTGGPVDEPEDLSVAVWAGVVPVALVTGTPEPAADLCQPLPPPQVDLAIPLRNGAGV